MAKDPTTHYKKIVGRKIFGFIILPIKFVGLLVSSTNLVIYFQKRYAKNV